MPPSYLANTTSNRAARNVDVQFATAMKRGAMKELARRRLIPFTEFTFAGDYVAYEVHRFIAEQFEKLERGDLRRVILSMPPQYGKSELASIRFPAWYLGKNPNKRLLLASYGGNLASYFGGEIRNLVASRKYTELFPHVELRQDSKAKNEWYLRDHRGGLVAAGVGGGLTGRPADVVIIDDPVKDEKTVRSTAYRENVIRWYKTVIYTRLSPDAAVIIIGTRWHKRDLIGYLLEESSEKWTDLKLSALADENDPMGRAKGTPLCPERHDIDKLQTIKQETGIFWFINWQQTPPEEGGGMIERAWFEVIDDLPPREEIIADIRYWDLAVTEKETANKNDPDFSVGTRILVWKRAHNDERLIIQDVVAGQWDWSDVQIEIAAAASVDGRAVTIVIEKVGTQKGLISDVLGNPALRGFAVEDYAPRGDKVLRVQPFAARAKAGRVYLLRGGWNQAWLSWVEGFPLLDHDDHVDSAATGYQYLSGDNVDWTKAVW